MNDALRLPGLTTGGFVPTDERKEHCFVTTVRGNDCQELGEFVVEATNAPGYMVCCATHKDNFLRDNPQATVKVWSLVAFNASRRAELDALIFGPR